MLAVIGGIVAVAAVAGFIYLGRERLGPSGVGLVLLRTGAMAGLFVLLVNPAGERPDTSSPATVLLDASLSLGASGGHWRAALDSARALAGPDGVIFRIGDGVAPFDTAPPTAGVSRALEGLRSAAGRSGPVYLLTDGEMADVAALPRALAERVAVVLFPRDTVPDGALLDVAIPERARAEDAIPLTLELATWGALDADSGIVTVTEGGRVLLRAPVALPPPPGVARRAMRIPAGALAPGTHVLDVAVDASGDGEPGDDRRVRVVTITAVPAVVLVVRPADWEGRTLLAELRDVTRATVRGFAEIGLGAWVDMTTLDAVDEGAVRRATAGAALAVTRGNWSLPDRRQPRWRWLAPDGDLRVAPGDWYPVGPVPASPLGGPLGAVEWDSLPPLTGVVPIAPVEGEYTALSARLGRRGAERPVVVGRDSAGMRELTTAASGMWRWALRGGASREAYRAVLAAGVDWLLGSPSVAGRDPLAAVPVVSRGMPVTFRRAPQAADSMTIRISGPDSAFATTLAFDAEDAATVRLPPGVYRWRLEGGGTTGIVAVEAYSDEFHPNPVTVRPGARASGVATLLVNARQRWWVFVLVLAAFVGEWAWRTRRGLP